MLLLVYSSAFAALSQQQDLSKVIIKAMIILFGTRMVSRKDAGLQYGR
jgi:hypothetical protein